MKSKLKMGHRSKVTRILVVLAVFVGMVGIIELYRWIVPFHSVNPIWNEVTINEPVIDDWRYGGLDEEGYLRFYDNNGPGSIVLPPNAHTLDLNGKFIVIEHFTPSSLTFALPIEAIPAKWLLIGAAVVGVLGGLVTMRLKRRPRRMNLKMRRAHPSFHLPNVKPVRRKAQRFRARRRP